jgi:hypothetical protein
VCTQCSPGTNSAGGASACTPCAAGSFSPDGLITCAACPVGTYAPETGMSQCLPCPHGMFAAPGATECTGCPAGTYSLATIGSAEQCTVCPAGSYCQGGVYGPINQLVACPFGTSQMATMATNASACAPCPAQYYCPSAAILRPCPTGTTSGIGSTSELQCACVLGYTCRYKKLISATVTLGMSKVEFTRAETTQAFVRAVAAAASVGVGEINIVSVVESAGGTPAPPGRRLLQANPPQAAAPGVHVQLQVRNAVGLNDLDARLAGEGLAASASHSHFEVHSVDVRRVPAPRLLWR